jgi:hypothetical protein
LIVIAGAKVTPLLRNSSFLKAFFFSFFDFGFKALKTRALNTKVFETTQASPCGRVVISPLRLKVT